MAKICRRTDLACEANGYLASIEGTDYRVYDKEICVIERLDILSDEAAIKLSKDKGRYFTVSTPRLQFLEERELTAIAHEISSILRNTITRSAGIASIGKSTSVLIVGLGNSKITADAIGPETVGMITVTRHLQKYSAPLFSESGRCLVSAIAPDVIGKTGIESAETVKAIAERIKPNAIIAIDALAARSVERLARTFQISDTGITPGEGVGNAVSELSHRTLGIPVIALGVPTVVDSSTLALDILEEAGLTELTEKIENKLHQSNSFFVTPKETDVIIEKAARLLADSIDGALVISE